MSEQSAGSDLPWYRRCLRWGQTNLTEIDPVRYDGEWWRAQWRRTRLQGVIVNAGGIVAYYPSRFPLHHRAEFLGDRDLYGEIVAAAREENLAVLARMDSNRADERFYVEHPDWFTVDAAGRPYRSGDRYVACINSAYYDEFLPGVLREIVERSHPDGFTDNSWSGLERDRVCHCANCRRRFRDATDHALPAAVDWDAPAYRAWIRWNYDRRLEVWELNNRVTKDVGGADCLWLGMIGGDVLAQSGRFRDVKGICERTEIVMLDFQARHQADGFGANVEAGTLLHGLLGWDTLIPESMAMYGAGRPTFRLGSKPEPEARLWAVAGFAGGIQPWWHHIGAYHEDRRQYRTAESLFRWHEEHQAYLVDRLPAATVGVVWSQENVDFYGRDAADERVMLPWRGAMAALRRARIPFIPIHADHIGRDGDAHGLRTLVLPNVAALADAQAAAVRAFAERGGGLLATGDTARYDEAGAPRSVGALDDLLGVEATGAHHGSTGPAERSWEEWAKHSYLRLAPELRAGTDGPRIGDEPPLDAGRHPVLAGFDDTDLVGFAGRLSVVRAAAGREVPLTFVPPFPIYPPETSWMRHPRSSLAALVLSDGAAAPGGRVAFLAADLDRCYGRDNHPDHARLLANIVRWTAGDTLPLEIDGPGLLDCALYRQPGRLVLHLVNLSHEGAARGPVHELLPVGPLSVRVRRAEGVGGDRVRFLVGGGSAAATVGDTWLSFEIGAVADHEVVVIG